MTWLERRVAVGLDAYGSAHGWTKAFVRRQAGSDDPVRDWDWLCGEIAGEASAEAEKGHAVLVHDTESDWRDLRSAPKRRAGADGGGRDARKD